MKQRAGFLIKGLLFSVFILLVSSCEKKRQGHEAVIKPVEFWLTTGDKSSLLKRVDGIFFSNDSVKPLVIDVDTTQRFQPIDGFGFSLTGGSAYLINQKLTTDQRDKLLRELFLTDIGIGVSYLRISVGSSDLDDEVFSYDDLPKGKT